MTWKLRTSDYLFILISQVIHIRKLKGLLDLVVLKSLKAVEMYSDKCFSMSATLIQALPYEEQERIK